MNHPLLNQTVTLYRKTEDGILRRVLTGCGLHTSVQEVRDPLGKSEKKSFLLVVPGTETLLPGDRIVGGIGPETDNWQTLHPARLAGAFQIEKVTPYDLGGGLCHTQAEG